MDTALQTVSEVGISGLALRPLAERSATSTTAVYALFGSKEALQHAVLQRGFEDFAAHQAQVPVTDDPITDLAGLGARYVEWALDHPRLYEAMFGRRIAGLTPSAELLEAGARGMDGVTDAVRRAVAAGAFRPGDVATIVTSLWSQVHGLASLMIADHLLEGADPVAAALATIDGWRA